MESHCLFRVGFSSLIKKKNISKIRQSNLLWRFLQIVKKLRNVIWGYIVLLLEVISNGRYLVFFNACSSRFSTSAYALPSVSPSVTQQVIQCVRIAQWEPCITQVTLKIDVPVMFNLIYLFIFYYYIFNIVFLTLLSVTRR